MFGWLTTRSAPPCRRAPPIVVSRRIRRTTPYEWISMLPGLGSVLYLHDASRSGETLQPGVLVTDDAFAPLLETCWLIAVSAVTDDGPREWCECVDQSGRTRARWHLLPDTDYLGWDALTAACAAFSPLDLQPLRARHASVVNFRIREFAGMLVLEHGRSAALSPLGDHVAARIAHAESAALYA